jgi:hypothetical protein
MEGALPLVVGRLGCRGFVRYLTHSQYTEITYSLLVGMGGGGEVKAEKKEIKRDNLRLNTED